MRKGSLHLYVCFALAALRAERVVGLASRRFENLPARLLAARLRPFRVEVEDVQTGLPRVLAFHANHAGIVLTKARVWGLTVTKIDELPPDA